MTYATLPRELVINGTVHTMHYKDDNYIVYQNYSSPVATSQNPLTDPSPGIQGQSMFHLYRIITGHGEELGELVQSYSSLDAATARAQQG